MPTGPAPRGAGRRSAAGRAKKGSPTPLTAALTTPSSNVGAVATCRSAGFDEREPTPRPLPRQLTPYQAVYASTAW
ncbi:hypothetical protein [Nonomuraea sp. NPDC001831]|uniref:hypothetical protein n=1 Tax=Nonomuraea sp. NPDC001831 TaxID=3364340 RepID=UPI00368C4F05